MKVMNIYTSINCTTKYKIQKWTELKRGREKSVIQMEEYHSTLFSDYQKNQAEEPLPNIRNLNSILGQLDNRYL